MPTYNKLWGRRSSGAVVEKLSLYNNRNEFICGPIYHTLKFHYTDASHLARHVFARLVTNIELITTNLQLRSIEPSVCKQRSYLSSSQLDPQELAATYVLRHRSFLLTEDEGEGEGEGECKVK